MKIPGQLTEITALLVNAYVEALPFIWSFLYARFQHTYAACMWIQRTGYLVNTHNFYSQQVSKGMSGISVFGEIKSVTDHGEKLPCHAQ